MAAAYKSHNTAISASGTSIAVTVPTHAAGDRLFFLLAAYDNNFGVTLAPPNVGTWTTEASGEYATPGQTEQIKFALYSRIATGSEPATLTGTTNTSIYKVAAILVVSSPDAATALDVAAVIGSGNTTTRGSAGLTTATAGALLAMFSIGYNGTVATPPSPMTQRVVWDTVNYLYTEARPTAGATGTRNATQSAGSAYITVLFAVKPASGGTVYNDAGQGTATAVASGADALTTAAAGQGTSPATGAGADSLTTAAAGQGTAEATGGAVDALTLAEAGQGTSTAIAGGVDAWSAADAGQGMATATGAGLDGWAAGDAGGASATATGAGADTLAATDAGEGLSTAEAGGLDTFSGGAEDAGQGTAVATAGGLDTLTFAEAGAALALAIGAGLDALTAAEAGQATAAAAGGGADTFSGGAVWNETGGATSAASAGGLDALVMAETGGGLVVAVGGGADSSPTDTFPAGATLTPRSPLASLTAASPAATLAAAGLPAATLTPRSPVGTLTAASPAGTLTPAA